MTLDRERLSKVAEMFRSPYEGERLAALERANAILESAGMTWTDLVCCQAPAPAPAPRPGRGRRSQPFATKTQDFQRYAALARTISGHPGFRDLPRTAKRTVARILISTTDQISASDAHVLDLLARHLGILQGADA